MNFQFCLISHNHDGQLGSKQKWVQLDSKSTTAHHDRLCMVVGSLVDHFQWTYNPLARPWSTSGSRKSLLSIIYFPYMVIDFSYSLERNKLFTLKKFLQGSIEFYSVRLNQMFLDINKKLNVYCQRANKRLVLKLENSSSTRWLWSKNIEAKIILIDYTFINPCLEELFLTTVQKC